MLSHNTVKLTFQLPAGESMLLPVGSHFLVGGIVSNKLVVRPYTPISMDSPNGEFTLVVKIYKAGQHPKFPEGGKLSQFLGALKIGEIITVRGPTGDIEYKGAGQLVVAAKDSSGGLGSVKEVKQIGLICGGTGLTPAYSVLKHILGDVKDTTQVKLLYANQKEEDILLREELDALAAANPDRFSVWYTLDEAPADWKYSTGFIDEAMVARHLPPPSPTCHILMCGPPPMIKFACAPNLEKVGHSAIQCSNF